MALIDIRPSERMLVAGTSGSGKTTLVFNVLAPRYALRPVVFDPKERLEPPDDSWRIVRAFHPRLEKQIIRLGDYEERDGPPLWDAQVSNILKDGNRTLIIDELTLCTGAVSFPPYLRRAIFTGRDYKRGSVGVWMITQRPSRIPTSAFSESRHLISFPLTREDDRDKWGKETHPQVIDELEQLAQHDYVYYDSTKKRIVVVPSIT